MDLMMIHPIIENIFEHSVNDFLRVKDLLMIIFLASSNNRTAPSSSSSQQQRQNGDKEKKTVKDV
jgi:hypothetical protein